MRSDRGTTAARYFATKLTPRQRFKRLFTWHYIRQTSLILPFYERWLNRG